MKPWAICGQPCHMQRADATTDTNSGEAEEHNKHTQLYYY